MASGAKKDRRSFGVARWLNPFALGLFIGLGLSMVDLNRRTLGAAILGHATAPGPECAGRVAPTDIPPRGWRDVAVRSVKEFNKDHIPAAAAGVTFYILLAIFPALSAFVSLYGLFANVDDARQQILALSGLLPGGAISILSDQLMRLTSTDHGSLGLAFAVSLIVSLWSANAGIKSLMASLNIAYETRERRGFVRLNLVSLAFTASAIALAAIGIAAVVAAPSVFDRIGLSESMVVAVLRWPLLLALMIGLFSMLYRFGPSRHHPRWRWITPGGCVAAIGWMVMSGLFSWYVANFGHYDKTYGSLGAAVGFLTWIWLSLMVVLFGAELNSEIEQQAKGKYFDPTPDD